MKDVNNWGDSSDKESMSPANSQQENSEAGSTPIKPCGDHAPLTPWPQPMRPETRCIQLSETQLPDPQNLRGHEAVWRHKIVTNTVGLSLTISCAPQLAVSPPPRPGGGKPQTPPSPKEPCVIRLHRLPLPVLGMLKLTTYPKVMLCPAGLRGLLGE